MILFNNITFLENIYFLLLLLIPIFVYLFYKKQISGIKFIYLKDLKNIFKTNSIYFYLKIILFLLIFINFVIIFANPNKINISENVSKNGIDIVLVLDVSSSMEAQDLKPSRIGLAKKVINDFIEKSTNNRFGLVVFAGKPFSSIPLTFDKAFLLELVGRTSTDNIDGQRLGGTAIGDSILMAKTLFKTPENIEKNDYEKREKVIILLTDGDDNIGVDPISAGLEAKKDGIKIYTIGVGSKKGGFINYNIGLLKNQQEVGPLNSESLKQIAKDTGGKFFRVNDNNTFNEVFYELSKLEKNNIEVEMKRSNKDYYTPFLYSLILFLGIFTYLIISKVEVKNNK